MDAGAFRIRVASLDGFVADDEDLPGFSYEVSDEMLEWFGRATALQRLTWLEEMRCFSWAVASEETRAHWRQLRTEPSPKK